MKKYNVYISLLVFTIILCISNISCSSSDSEYTPYYQPKTKEGIALLQGSVIVSEIFHDTSFTVAKGVEEIDIHFLKMDGQTTHLFLLRIDMDEPGVNVSVSLPFDKDVENSTQKQTLREMAKYADKPGRRVAGMINGDFYDVQTIELRGPMHRNGVIIKDHFSFSERLPQQALSFIAITNDNQMVIADSIEYKDMASELKEVTGAGVFFLRNGVTYGKNFPQVDPRTAIGHTTNNIVYFLVVDGRSALYSNGMTYNELAETMKSLGVINASNLDGGGSTEMIIRNPIANVWQVRNRPSDGSERPVANGWMITVDEP